MNRSPLRPIEIERRLKGGEVLFKLCDDVFAYELVTRAGVVCEV